jgi:carbon storage regulator
VHGFTGNDTTLPSRERRYSWFKEDDMLVLSRKLGETVCIGTDITLSIVELKGNRVRIGIEAPKQIEIWRGELCVEPSPSAAGTFPRSPFGD